MTEEEKQVYLNFAEAVGEVGRYTKNKEEEKKLFNQLSTVEGLKEYLVYLSSVDLQRYFQATSDEQRAIIKGMTARNAYLLSRLDYKNLH